MSIEKEKRVEALKEYTGKVRAANDKLQTALNLANNALAEANKDYERFTIETVSTPGLEPDKASLISHKSKIKKLEDIVNELEEMRKENRNNINDAEYEIMMLTSHVPVSRSDFLPWTLAFSIEEVIKINARIDLIEKHIDSYSKLLDSEESIPLAPHVRKQLESHLDKISKVKDELCKRRNSIEDEHDEKYIDIIKAREFRGVKDLESAQLLLQAIDNLEAKWQAQFFNGMTADESAIKALLTMPDEDRQELKKKFIDALPWDKDFISTPVVDYINKRYGN